MGHNSLKSIVISGDSVLEGFFVGKAMLSCLQNILYEEGNILKIVIDCRFMNHSGLGRYTCEIVSRLVYFFENEYILLLNRDEIHQEFLDRCRLKNVSFLYIDAPMYSLHEQLLLPLRIPSCDLFWALHYNAPILPVRAKYKMVTIHDVGHLALQEDLSFFKRCYAKLLMYTSTHFYDKILTVSEFSKREIIRFENILEERVAVYPCAVDMNEYCPVRDRTHIDDALRKYALPNKYFLYVGNVKPHKNILGMIKGYAKFLQNNAGTEICLVVVGKKDGLLTGVQGLPELLKKFNLENRVFFTGFVDEEDLPSLYSGAQAFLFPSFYEGFGIPALEAMACNCVVVSSTAASLPEVCGDAAIYVDPRSEISIAAGLETAKEEAEKMKEKGLERVKRFSWDNTTVGIQKLIQSFGV